MAVWVCVTGSHLVGSKRDQPEDGTMIVRRTVWKDASAKCLKV